MAKKRNPGFDYGRAWEKTKDRLSKLTGGRCWYCGCFPQSHNLAMDHVIPRGAPGSSDDDWNLVVACIGCNGAKGNRSPEHLRFILARKAAGWPYFSAEQLAFLEGIGVSLPGGVIFYGESIGLALPTRPLS